MKTFQSLTAKHFGPIVGQEIPKTRIAKGIFGTTLEGGYMSPILLVAPPGVGKTRILTAAQALYKDIWGDARASISCTSGEELGSRDKFFEKVLVEHVEGKAACFFVDEFHKTQKPVQSLFRSMIEITEKRNAKTVQNGDLSVTICPKKHGFMFATDQVDKLDPALISRCKRIDLSPYCDADMETILFNSLEGDKIQFHPNTLRMIAECNRGTARNVVHWIDSIRQYLAFAGKRSLNREDTAAIIRESETFTLGVTKNELAILLHLEKNGPMKLKELSAQTGASSEAQDANERYLLQRGLLRISTKRELTPDGAAYLVQLRKDRMIPAREVSANNLVQVA